MPLFNKKNLDKIKSNKYGISKDDITGKIEGFPVGVVIRMMEEQERQGNEPNIKVFTSQKIFDRDNGGFTFMDTPAGFSFWNRVIWYRKFNIFFEIYPEYEKYN